MRPGIQLPRKLHNVRSKAISGLTAAVRGGKAEMGKSIFYLLRVQITLTRGRKGARAWYANNTRSQIIILPARTDILKGISWNINAHLGKLFCNLNRIWGKCTREYIVNIYVQSGNELNFELFKNQYRYLPARGIFSLSLSWTEKYILLAYSWRDGSHYWDIYFPVQRIDLSSIIVRWLGQSGLPFNDVAPRYSRIIFRKNFRPF